MFSGARLALASWFSFCTSILLGKVASFESRSSIGSDFLPSVFIQSSQFPRQDFRSPDRGQRRNSLNVHQEASQDCKKRTLFRYLTWSPWWLIFAQGPISWKNWASAVLSLNCALRIPESGDRIVVSVCLWAQCGCPMAVRTINKQWHWHIHWYPHDEEIFTSILWDVITCRCFIELVPYKARYCGETSIYSVAYSCLGPVFPWSYLNKGKKFCGLTSKKNRYILANKKCQVEDNGGSHDSERVHTPEQQRGWEAWDIRNTLDWTVGACVLREALYGLRTIHGDTSELTLDKEESERECVGSTVSPGRWEKPGKLESECRTAF